jgi:hypothetical protein
MPRFEGTSPQGVGRMAGPGMGHCRINHCNRFYSPILDYQKMYRHECRGRERGRRDHLNSFIIPKWALPTPEQEIAQLKVWAEN